MSGMRYVKVKQREMKFLDLTSLTVDEFAGLIPIFEEAFQERMKAWCLDGKPRTKRSYTTYINCPFPTPEDRLFFILVYLKTNVLQVVQGELFRIPQNKVNQWIHVLLPVLQETLRKLGDAPARSMEELALRLDKGVVMTERGKREVQNATVAELPEQEALDSVARELERQEAQGQENAPLFAMTVPNGVSNVLKTQMNRKAIIAARKNAIR